MISRCNEERTDKIISVNEKKRKFIIKNNSELIINQVKVDGCYITEGVRCDYLFETIDKVFYVELKGKDIEHGVEQLKATMAYCKTEHKNSSKECHIVASRVPKASTQLQGMKVKFKKSTTVQLFVSTNQKEIVV